VPGVGPVNQVNNRVTPHNPGKGTHMTVARSCRCARAQQRLPAVRDEEHLMMGARLRTWVFVLVFSRLVRVDVVDKSLVDSHLPLLEVPPDRTNRSEHDTNGRVVRPGGGGSRQAPQRANPPRPHQTKGLVDDGGADPTTKARRLTSAPGRLSKGNDSGMSPMVMLQSSPMDAMVTSKYQMRRRRGRGWLALTVPQSFSWFACPR